MLKLYTTYDSEELNRRQSIYDQAAKVIGITSETPKAERNQLARLVMAIAEQGPMVADDCSNNEGSIVLERTTHHLKAAEHYELAARHHKQAARLDATGDRDRADDHVLIAREHVEKASYHCSAALRFRKLLPDVQLAIGCFA